MGGAINLQYCQDAPSRITAVAQYDAQLDQYFVDVLDDTGTMKPSKKGNRTVRPHKTEASLLLSVLDTWESIDPTILITWNGDGFDVPYMYNRMCRVIGEEQARRLSPLKHVYYDEYDPKMPYKIAGVNSLDLMRLFKKFIPKQQPSYALDAIAKKEIGRGKITYQGSLDTLFKNDPEKFIEYNVNDVELLVEIDRKKRFIDLAVMVCHMAHVPYHYVYQAARVVEGAIMTYLKRKDVVSPNKPTTMHPELKAAFGKETEEDKFAGAYVKDPIPGLYGWNGDLDLESLYPSLGIMLNIGIETFLFKIMVSDPFDDSWNLVDMKEKDPDENITVINLEGRISEIILGDLIDMIEENDVLIAPNGVVFDSKYESILAEVMNHWFKKRKEFKSIMISKGKEQDKAGYELYDRYQQVMKVFLNSIYGVLGLKSFRYGDGKDYCASAITAAGRLTIMQSADYANNLLHEIFDENNPIVDDKVIMSDTDSMYIEADSIIRCNEIDPNDDEKVVELLRNTFKVLADMINEYYITFSKDRFNSSKNRLKTKSETIGKKLYVSVKKQYAQYIIDKEGVRMEGEDRFDFKGLDFMKSSFPPLFRTFTQGLVKDILFDKKKAEIDSKILDFREKFKDLPLADVAKPVGINKDLRAYVRSRPKKGVIFSEIMPKTGVHLKSAIFYNDLLKFKELDKKHPVLQVGDKIRWMYLKDNPYKIESLAFNPYDSPKEVMDFIEKYMDRQKMFSSVLVKKLEKIYENLHWGEINFNRNTTKFFKFKN
jgi:DNA polymerase elongation subunit (family B)